MTRQVLIAFIVFTVLGLGVVFWYLQDENPENKFQGQNAVKESEPIRILFVGDIMLSRSVGQEMRKRDDYLYPFRKVAEEVGRADLAFANLEGPISDRGQNQGSIYSFRADPRAAEGLAFAGFDVISVANNHIWDWGRSALEDTITLLQGKGISPVGAGKNEIEANTPVIRDVGGTKIAYLAYTNLYPESLEAKGSSPGISNFDKEKIIAQIQQANHEADIVVVSYHWGDEYQTESNALQQELARAIILAGADLVIGHHPHVSQEVEKYKEGWIVYSLGNFIFDQTFSEETTRGLAVTAVIKDKKVVDLEKRYVFISRSFQPTFGE